MLGRPSAMLPDYGEFTFSEMLEVFAPIAPAKTKTTNAEDILPKDIARDLYWHRCIHGMIKPRTADCNT